MIPQAFLSGGEREQQPGEAEGDGGGADEIEGLASLGVRALIVEQYEPRAEQPDDAEAGAHVKYRAPSEAIGYETAERRAHDEAQGRDHAAGESHRAAALGRGE